MKYYRLFFSLSTLSLLVLLLQGCATTEYAVKDLPKLGLSIEVEESSEVLVNTTREVVLRDFAGSIIHISHLDRLQNDDAEIGEQVIATAKEQGLELSSLKAVRLNEHNISGVYIRGVRNDSLVLIGGFIGLQSTDAYLAVLCFPQSMHDEAEHSMRSITFNRK